MSIDKTSIKDRIDAWLTVAGPDLKRILVHHNDYHTAISTCGVIYEGLPIETFKNRMGPAPANTYPSTGININSKVAA